MEDSISIPPTSLSGLNAKVGVKGTLLLYVILAKSSAKLRGGAVVPHYINFHLYINK